MTSRRREYLDAVTKHGSVTAAAKALGLSHQTVSEGIKALLNSTRIKNNHILVLPDVQAKPGHSFDYLRKIGQYMLDKKPATVVCIGDFADMPSLSSYDVGKKSFEGRRYLADVDAAKAAMDAFLGPMREYNASREAMGRPIYAPKMVLTLGNHENRIAKAVNDDPKLDGVLSVDHLGYKDAGWEVVPFLEVIVIEGVAFSHYFTSGVMGRPVSTASACLNKKHMSAVQGHQQGLQIATGYRGDGRLLTSVIAGSCYEHDEDYMSAQGNKHWRGFLMLHDVDDGAFDLMPVSLAFINKKYA